MSAAVCLVAGALSDNIKSYKLLLGNNLIVTALDILMVWNISTVDLKDLDLLFDVALTVTLGVHVASFMLSVTILAKLTNERTRGSMFAFNAVLGSAGILILQYFGGILYSGGSKSAPFLITTVSFGVCLLANIFFGLSGKLKV